MLEVKKILSDQKHYLPLLRQSGIDEATLQEKLDHCDLYVLFSNDACISALMIEFDRDTCDIIAIVTEESHRNQGYAARLVEYVSDDYARKASRLQIVLPKSSAEPFYRLGFAPMQKEADFIRMEKDLKELD